MTPYHTPAHDAFGARIVFANTWHRVPGSMVKRKVPIFDTVFVDHNACYSPNGKREVARRLRQMGGAS